MLFEYRDYAPFLKAGYSQPGHKMQR